MSVCTPLPDWYRALRMCILCRIILHNPSIQTRDVVARVVSWFILGIYAHGGQTFHRYCAYTFTGGCWIIHTVLLVRYWKTMWTGYRRAVVRARADDLNGSRAYACCGRFTKA